MNERIDQTATPRDVLELIARINAVVIDRFSQMSDEERQPIMERAIQLRVGPTGYSDEEALRAAMHEMIPVPDDDISASRH
jgi:hypothetical protein